MYGDSKGGRMVRSGDYGVLERVDLHSLPREREKLTGWGSRATGRIGAVELRFACGRTAERGLRFGGRRRQSVLGLL
ncbi:hypothetical protein SO802_018285 [Lithocarpus litseifolius]|uniref:Uncharacterized protein n=1 Tax=Lithocarpus litseifolius TaxID=425828 RepID=A0AAW2CKE8_9ROSI